MFNQNKWIRAGSNREVAFQCDIPKRICKTTNSRNGWWYKGSRDRTVSKVCQRFWEEADAGSGAEARNKVERRREWGQVL